MRWLVVLALGAPLGAFDLPLCTVAAKDVDRLTVSEMKRELIRIAGVSGWNLREGCNNGSVVLRVLRKPDPAEPTALGSARYSAQGIQPDLQVFAQPIAALAGTTLPGVVGRAMARAAAHELAHYVAQQRGHDARGVLAESMSAGKLLGAPVSEFRIPSVNR